MGSGCTLASIFISLVERPEAEEYINHQKTKGKESKFSQLIFFFKIKPEGIYCFSLKEHLYQQEFYILQE